MDSRLGPNKQKARNIIFCYAETKATRKIPIGCHFESPSQIALMVSSWLNPRGFSALFRLAKYQLMRAPPSGFAGPLVSMRPPGISRNPFLSCSFSQPQA